MQKPLEGIKVVELGIVLAAPYCGLLLRALGAVREEARDDARVAALALAVGSPARGVLKGWRSSRSGRLLRHPFRPAARPARRPHPLCPGARPASRVHARTKCHTAYKDDSVCMPCGSVCVCRGSSDGMTDQVM